MKPKIFKWRGLWYVSFLGGYDLALRDGGFPDWQQALKYALTNGLF